MRTPSLREHNSPSCVPAQLRGAEIAPYARADDRGGQRVLHRAGVEDADNVAGPGRRERAEERPVQPVLTVQLDDLRKHPSESRYAAVTHRGWRTKPILIAQIGKAVEKMIRSPVKQDYRDDACDTVSSA